jgi:hypothetical protein
MGLRILLVVSAALFAFGGCSKTPVRPPHEGDRSSGPAGGGGEFIPLTDGGVPGVLTDGGDAGDCTDLANTGLVVDENAVAGDFAAAGGEIADGTYNIVEAQLYLGASGGFPGPTNRSFQGSIRVTGGKYESVLVTRTAGVAGAEARSEGTLTANGASSATLALTCPTGSEEQLAYSVTATGLTLSNTATRETFVFAKAP